jgi:hypothetical protein
VSAYYVDHDFNGTDWKQLAQVRQHMCLGSVLLIHHFDLTAPLVLVRVHVCISTQYLSPNLLLAL